MQPQGVERVLQGVLKCRVHGHQAMRMSLWSLSVTLLKALRQLSSFSRLVKAQALEQKPALPVHQLDVKKPVFVFVLLDLGQRDFGGRFGSLVNWLLQSAQAHAAS